MVGRGLIAVAAVGVVIVLLAAALGIAAIAVSDREDRWPVILIVGIGGLTFFCCIAAALAGVVLLFTQYG